MQAKTIVTIGVYGWDPETFVTALKMAKVTALVDIRRRRGVRGAEYAFANAQRLQRLMEENGIGYVAELALAPPKQLLDYQHAVDKASRTALRKRERLDPQYVAGYKSIVLKNFTAAQLDALLERAGKTPAFLCVERDARACHRSLAGEFIAKKTGAEIRHLTPGG